MSKKKNRIEVDHEAERKRLAAIKKRNERTRFEEIQDDFDDEFQEYHDLATDYLTRHCH